MEMNAYEDVLSSLKASIRAMEAGAYAFLAVVGIIGFMTHGQYHDHQHHHQKTGTGRFAGCGYDQQTAKPDAPVRRPVFYPGNCSRIPDRGPPRRLQSLSVYEKCRMDRHSHVSRPSGGNTLYDSCHRTAPINALIHLEQKCEKGIPGGKDSASGVKSSGRGIREMIAAAVCL